MRQNRTRRARNEITKGKYKALTKQYIKLVEAGDKKAAADLYPSVQKAIDIAAKKNMLHNKTAARRKSKLAKMLAPSA